MDYLVNLNLNKNELQNARVQNLAAAPSNPVEGQIYHNTADHVFYYYNGTKWVPVVDDGGVTSITGGTDISVSASTGAITINHSDIETTSAVSTAGIKKITTDGHGHIKTTGAAYASDLTMSSSDSTTVKAAIEAKATAATTLAGYGITDAKIQNDTITLGSNTLQIPTVPTDVSAFTNDAGYITNAALASYLPLSGGTLTGALTLSGAPTANLHAATKKYVDDAVDALPEPMVFKGSLGTSGTITTLPTASSSNEGWTYKVITAGTYASQAADVGDTFISDGSAWVLIPSGDEPSGTVTNVGISNTDGGITVSGGPITTSGTFTVNHTIPSGASAVATAKLYKIMTEKFGHVNGKAEATKADITGLLGNYVTGIKLGASATALTGEVTIPAVTQTNDGLMSAEDKTTLDNLEAASQGAITYTTLTIAQGQTSVSASGVASKLITFQAYQGGEAVVVDYDGTAFEVASAAASAITIKCVVTV